MASTVTAKSPKIKASIESQYSKETWLKWYETMLRIRKFEEKTLMMYSLQKIRGFCHVYIGQEAIAAGLVTGIKTEDALVTAYRQHGIALSRGLSAASSWLNYSAKKPDVLKVKADQCISFQRNIGFLVEMV